MATSHNNSDELFQAFAKGHNYKKKAANNEVKVGVRLKSNWLQFSYSHAGAFM